MANDTPWRIDDRIARLDDGDRSGELDLNRPDLGLNKLCWAGVQVRGGLWGWIAYEHSEGSANVGPAPPLLDAYTRGTDLVLTYGPTKSCEVETQIYWRCDPDRLSLMVSIRTQLLDTLPIVRVASHRPALATRLATHADPLSFDRPRDSKQPVSSGAIVAVQQEVAGGVATCEACQPNDGSELRLDDEQGIVAWELFSQFLEKGVIRRARLTFTVADLAEAERAAAEVYTRMLAEPLPLTT